MHAQLEPATPGLTMRDPRSEPISPAARRHTRIVAVTFGTAQVVGLCLLLLGCIDHAFAASKLEPIGTIFTCTPTRVWDGDGPIWTAEGHRIRLEGIATRELDNSCRPNQPCPAVSGTAARDRLVDLLGGATGRARDGHVIVAPRRLSCRSFGPDRYGRLLARVNLPAGDLGTLMVRSGAAKTWVYNPHSGRRRPHRV